MAETEAPRIATQTLPEHASESSGAAAGPQPLAASTRTRMESGFGADLAGVKIHANSSETGSAQALAKGNDVHFAPGQYQPGTSQGDWLIGHEMAHVVQQRKGSSATQAFDPGARRGILEAEADRAATTVAGGGRANIAFGAESGTVQKYEAWEHAQLGDAGGGGDQKIWVGKNPQVAVTYGQLVALSGDFFPNAEALYNAPGGEIQQILNVMKKEKSEAEFNVKGNEGKVDPVTGKKFDGPAQVWDRNANGGKGGYVDDYGSPTGGEANENNADYDNATFDWRNKGGRSHHDDHEDGGGAEHAGDEQKQENDPNANFGKNEDGGPSKNLKNDPSPTLTNSDGFTDLAKKNSSHFSPENIKLNWAPRHRDALVMAQEAWRLNNKKDPKDVKTPPSTVVNAIKEKKVDAPGQASADQSDNSEAQKKAGQAAAQKVVDGAKTPGADFGKAGSGPGSAQAAKALVMSGFSVHFLTDAFASGHLISGNVGRQVAGDWWAKNRSAVLMTLTQCAKRDLLRWKTSDRSVAALMTDPGFDNALLMLVEKGGGDGAINGMLLKIVHDTLNSSGLEVKNKAGAQWTTYGDGNMARSAETRTQGEAAAIEARKSVQDVVDKGDWKESEDEGGAYSAIRFVPSNVKAPDGKWYSVEAFALNPEMFEKEFQSIARNASPDANRFYQILKGNFYPQIQALAYQKSQSVINPIKKGASWLWDKAKGAASTAWDATKKGAEWAGEKAKEGYEYGKEKAQEGYQYGKEKAQQGYDWTKKKANDAWDWTKDKYQQGKQAVSDGVDTVEKKASSAWDWVKDKYQGGKQAIGEKLEAGKEVAKSLPGKAKKQVASWVADLFKSKAAPAPQGQTPELQPGEKTNVDSGTTPVDPIKNQEYAHGVFMGAAGEMMKDPVWNGIFRTLMPGEHAKASAITDAKQLIAFMENNPVIAAYGSAKTLAAKGGQGEHEANPKKGQAVPLEWDVWLDPIHPEEIGRAKIAHGNKGTTVGQHLVKDLPVGFIRDDIKSAPTASDWMNIFGRAIALWRGGGGDGKSKEGAEDQQKKLEQVANVDNAETAMQICAQFLQAPSGLILDVKSTYSSSQQINSFVHALKTKYNINVFGVGSFDYKQLQGVAEGAHGVHFYHSLDGLLHAAHESKGKETDPKCPLPKGSHVMFNGGSLLAEKKEHWYSKASGFQVDQAAIQKLQAVKQQYNGDLHIALYVQETDVGSDAIDVLTKLVNKMGSLFDEGFAYGNLVGKAESKTGGSGMGAQSGPAALEKASTLKDKVADAL